MLACSICEKLIPDKKNQSMDMSQVEVQATNKAVIFRSTISKPSSARLTRIHVMLMVRPCDSTSSSGRTLGSFEAFSISISTISVVVSERSVLGNEPAGDRTTPPHATDASRIDMRLLRDTRRVLEYLSRTNIYQSFPSIDVGHTK